MKKKVKVKESVKTLIMNGQTVNEINENLQELFEEWHNPDPTHHKNIMWVFKDLKKLLSNLNKYDTSSFNLQYIKSLFSIHPEDGIDKLLDGLHDLMINYIDTPDSCLTRNDHIKIFKSYRSLRGFLQELKLIEREANIEKNIINFN